MLMLLAAPAAPMQGAPMPPGPGFAQVMFHEHIVIRIPRMPMPPRTTQPDPMPPVEWREEKTEQCVASDTLVAASTPSSDRVDLVLNSGERLRARLDKKCRALDFYPGFYVVAGHDGQVCAGRDSIRTRSGDNCQIDKFRRLVPRR
jgi:hypothetical protein